MASHAQTPFAEPIGGDHYHIYFTSRDSQNRSHVGWLELDIRHPEKILHIGDTPLLAPGAPGAFDDMGTMMSCLVKRANVRYLYYTGWSIRQSVPYHLAIGLASAPAGYDDPVFIKLRGPVLERNPIDPLFCASPSVLIDDGHWRMWYVSGVGWPMVRGRVTPSYNIRYAYSKDGIDWRREGQIALELEGDEVGFSRPCVTMENGSYLMWYSVRAQDGRYQLSCASSDDGLTWRRTGSESYLLPSAEGWDSEMIAYPYVFRHGYDQFMLYCGNGYGRTGFGLAVLA